MLYAGIGSREVSQDMFRFLSSIGMKMATNEHTLRSGGAIGSDTAFETGHLQVTKHNIEIFRPDDISVVKYLEIANSNKMSLLYNACFEYPFDAMKYWTQQLLMRNLLTIIGHNLSTYVDGVICYTRDGQEIGGTRYAIRIAKQLNIPVLNVGNRSMYTKVAKWLKMVT